MSERELAALLLGIVPDYKLRYVIAYMQGLTAGEPYPDTENDSENAADTQ